MRHANVPPAFVVVQRVNLGMFAVLAQLGATADWRSIGEELWPWVSGPPSTELGRPRSRVAGLPNLRNRRSGQPRARSEDAPVGSSPHGFRPFAGAAGAPGHRPSHRPGPGRAPRARDRSLREEYPQDLFELFVETGLTGLCIPEEYGGSGAGILGLAIAIEEIAKYSNAAALMLLLTRLPTGALLIAGTEEQKQRVPDAARGRPSSGPRSGCPSPRPAATSWACGPGRSATATRGCSPARNVG